LVLDQLKTTRVSSSPPVGACVSASVPVVGLLSEKFRFGRIAGALTPQGQQRQGPPVAKSDCPPAQRLSIRGHVRHDPR
jgi:hypothetical protein